MASSRDMHPSPRPSLSNGSSAALPGRSSHVRTGSHTSSSLLTSSLNPNHRVTRRKSVTGPNANLAAVSDYLQRAEGTGEKTAALPIAGRRNTFSKTGRATVGSLPSPPASLPGKGLAELSSAIDDANESGDNGKSVKSSKARMRRASDGQPLMKEGGKKSQLTCEHCGKQYKHSSCLTKHLWEHTPQWSITQTYMISKHQQVQLLEAAKVLLEIEKESKVDSNATPPESAKDPASDVESTASPDASAYSEVDRLSSADTTPPPMAEGLGFRSNRLSSNGNYSRSYQSGPGSLPRGNELGHARIPSDPRPNSSGVINTGEDDRALAAALELHTLGGSLGSNQGSSGTVLLNDAPPVPPVPAQYRDQATSFGGSYMSSFPGRQPESFTRGGGDVRMGGSADSLADEDDVDMTRGVRSDEDDDGVFGSMEE